MRRECDRNSPLFFDVNMLELADIPFLAELPAASLAGLRAKCEIREWPQGSVIVRVGEEGRHFQAIASGAVRVLPNADTDGNWRGVMLGPGQVFGEMSIFSGMPVSATLVAARDTVTWCLQGPAFLQLLDNDPALHRSLTRLLIERLSNRTRQEGRVPGIAVIVGPQDHPLVARFTEGVLRGVHHYAPASEQLLLDRTAPGGLDLNTQCRERISTWRRLAAGGQYLVVAVEHAELQSLGPLLEPADIVLDLQLETGHAGASLAHAGVAYLARVRLQEPTPRDPGLWTFRVPPQELDAVHHDLKIWQRQRYPALDRLVRHITFKEVGVALSSGAARGFAHLGVLMVLEDQGIPLDYLCGTSMGGIAALTLARAGGAHQAEALMRHYLGSNRRIRDAWGFPRSSLFRGQKVASAAAGTFGDCTFADLDRPVAVVAADLAAGERMVLDRGPVGPAVLATSAIPGLFPPVQHFSRVLVDGVVVSRVPVDVLSRRRCGLKIAVNVLPSARQVQDGDQSGLIRFWSKMSGPLGFRRVLSTSWELIGSWGSTLEAMRADIVIVPDTPTSASFDFDRFDELVNCGRVAGEERIEGVRDSLRAMFES